MEDKGHAINVERKVVSKIRQPQELSNSLEAKLKSYSVAASMAGVGVLAIAHSAEAKIIYHHFGGHVKHPTDSFVMTKHGAGEFIFHFQSVSGLRKPSSVSGGASRLIVYGGKPSNTVVSASSDHTKWAAALESGTKIGPFAGAAKVPMLSGGGDTESIFSYGPWAPGTDVHFSRYLGVRFEIRGEVHYGWIRVHINPVCGYCKDGGKLEAYVNGVAYESIPNKPIKAGQEKGNLDPHPATLGALAAGAPAISTWR